MLLGLVTKTAILLIDYTNQARTRGLNIRDALLEACSLRLRPIMMTTLSTILGMSGPGEGVMDIARDYGVGLNIATIEFVRPGYTVGSENPDVQELTQLIQKVLKHGLWRQLTPLRFITPVRAVSETGREYLVFSSNNYLGLTHGICL